MIRGMIAGSFDVIHPGYIRVFKAAKENACDWLIIALQGDPTIERPHKIKPILTVAERVEVLMALEHIDEIVHYNTEAELFELLKQIKPTVRILGSDYREKEFTGHELAIPVYYHHRDHEWSTTRFKNEITEQVLKQRAQEE